MDNQSYFGYIFIFQNKDEVRNPRVTKSSYEIELPKMTSRFELLTRKNGK